MRTVTFYSYKGGVGRTLAVANTALRLARLGQKVFTVDFDIEAPGLHHKWGLYPRRGPLHIERGLVDFLHDYVVFDRLPGTLEAYVIDVTEPGGKAAPIFFMPAGRAPSRSYAEQLARLDWHDLLYTEHGEGVPLFLDLKARIREEFAPDVLLIDARTGLTEMGGVATSLLADQVFGLTLRHHEHLEGTRAVLRGLRRVPRLEGDAPVRAEAILARLPQRVHLAVEHEKLRVKAYLNELAERLEDTLALRDVLVIRAEPSLETDEQLMLGGVERELPLLYDYLRIVERILGPDEPAPGQVTLVPAPPDLAGPSPNNLPPRRLFVGRAQERRHLDEALRREGPTSIAQAALWGIGGVGKTALALEYAYGALDAGTYPAGIFWVLAEGSPVDAMGQLAGILQKHVPKILADLPAHTPPADVAEAVKYALEALPVPSLVVLDNVSERWAAELLPGGQVGVLMTMRDHRLWHGKAIALDALSPEDARALAIDLTAKTPEDDAEEAALGRVLDTQLGGLAVAVEVAARAVRAWAHSWVDCEKLLATQPREVLDAWEDRSPNYEPGVFAALDLSIDRCDQTARRLLEGTAVFAPDAVPLEWAHAAAGLDPEDTSTKRALGELSALALVKRADETSTLSMHRLVHKRVRDRAEAQAWSAASTRAVGRVKSWIRPAVGRAKEQMDAVEACRKHIMEALAAAERVDNMQEWSFIANEFALHLQNRAEYEEARSLWERALALDEKSYGPEHERVATRLSNLAMALKELRKPAEARPLMERSLAIAEKIYGPEHWEVATRMLNLAMVLVDLKEPASAVPLLERALTIDEKNYGPEHPHVAGDLSNLALVLRELSEPAQALPLAERALAIDEKTYGSEHPDVATRLAVVATVLHDLGELAQARLLLERSLAIAEKTYGPEHRNVAIPLSNLAAVLQGLGQPAQARPLLERALAIAEKTLPPVHPMRARIAKTLESL